MLYKYFFRPIFFKIDPEKIHKLIIVMIGLASKIPPVNYLMSKFFKVEDSSLEVKIGKLHLKNPVGLAAGFDKYIDAPLAYPMLGFGFAELGSVTYTRQPGNPKPRLWRLPKDKGLIVYYGLSNGGAENTASRFKKIKHGIFTYGLSIAPTTGLDLNEMSEDYLKTFLRLRSYADYITFNVSCPNVAACESFAQVSFVVELADKIKKVMVENKIDKEIFIKIGPHFNEAELDQLVVACEKAGLTGFVVSNLIKDRTGIKFNSSETELNHPGGVSGSLLAQKSNQVISYIYKKSSGKLKIIGVGGIFTAEDAYKKIKCGASAVQLITGWIYGGPFTIKEINKGLIELLKKDGLKNISEAVGKGV